MVKETIVIGSGIGGLTAAAALSKCGHRVTVLEQHHALGGMTQTFVRDGFSFNVGVHYLGDMGPDGHAGKLLHWLADGGIKMAPAGPVYDIARFPGDFEFPFSRPEASLVQTLRERFPHSQHEIDRFLIALIEAEQAGQAVIALRAMPEPLAGAYRFWKHRVIQRWCTRTTKSVLDELISDPKLRAVLSTQWGDYGGPPSESCFAMHAIVMRHYMGGSHFPIGGAAVFAQALGEVIRSHGGSLHTNARVTEFVVKDGGVTGVRLSDRREVVGERVVSDIGARNTVDMLFHESTIDGGWVHDVRTFNPSVAHIGVYIGLEGDIAARGASSANYWLYETWTPGEVRWTDPFEQSVAPGMYVSFPSLKDPSHVAGASQRHTAEIVVLADSDLFRQWENSRLGKRPDDYLALKEVIRKQLMHQFTGHFPGLTECVRFSEISTPLSTAHFTGAMHGATYGLETSVRRFMSSALNAKTPIPGLYLAGQDVGTPGVVGSMMGGMLAAAAIEPRLFIMIR